METIILKNGTIISPQDNLNLKSDIKIENGVITQIEKEILPKEDDEVKDCTDLIISPGFVELHSHLREPGFESKETIQTGLASALKGGYTCVLAMANTNPCVDNELVFNLCENKAKEVSPIEFHQVCAVTKGLTSSSLTDFRSLKKLGAIAFSNDGKPIENLLLLKYALEYAKSLDTLIMLHSEVSELANGGVINEGFTSSKMGLQGILDIAESAAVARELEVIKSTEGARVHFCHISTKKSVELIRSAKAQGLNVTCETAPHYFSLCDEDIKEYDARFKMNPPLRSKTDKEAIIEGIVDGTIDAIATDHAPHTVLEKTSPIQNAPMGIVGFETAFSLTVTNLVKKHYIPLSRAIELLASTPAKILKLNNQGSVKIGNISNLSVFSESKRQIVNASTFKSKSKISPFDGKELTGVVEFVVINGKIYE